MYGGRNRFFIVVAKVILGMEATSRISLCERKCNWDRIVFFKIVQLLDQIPTVT